MRIIKIIIPESLGPLDRAEKYEDPLNNTLVTENLGKIISAGTYLSENVDHDGKREITNAVIEIDLNDFDKGIKKIIKNLKFIEAPSGTVIQFQDSEMNEYEIDIFEFPD